MDSSYVKKLVGYLQQLGLNAEQSAVYLFLTEHGPSSVLEISRGLKSGRTKLYPLLEELAHKQLVVAHERHYGTTYESLGVAALEFLVAEQETKAAALRGALPAAVAELERLKSYSPSGSRVVEYHGIEGLKQMNFNLSKAEKEYRTFELANLDKHPGMPRYFVEKQRQTQVENKVTSYDLTNNAKWKVSSNVPGYEKYSQGRFIEPNVFKIGFESVIYNNCVALFNFDAKDIFGVEIYNAALAAQQKQLFDLLWGMAKPL